MSSIVSPWLAQLTERRPFELSGDVQADVAIVGAGIAGISTAAMILQETDLSVALVDAGRIAHGATGHNAGHLVATFERPFADLVDAFGLRPSVQALAEVEGGWNIIDDLSSSFSLKTPLYNCQGFLGFTSLKGIRAHLEDSKLRTRYGLEREPLLIAVGSSAEKVITEVDEPFIARLPHSMILRLLRTDDASFVAAATSRGGCMNSALFCEELAGSFLASHKDRISIAEHLPVRELTLTGNAAILQTDGPTIRAQKVILCTNGFENIRINNDDGPAIDRSFHRLVQGVIGYMGGYLGSMENSPLAVAYFREQETHIDPYVYLTRRPYDNGKQKTLMCLGGPERILPDSATYDPLMQFPSDIEEEIDRAFMETYRKDEEDASEKSFLWHGVMGYTPSGVRCVGQDPRSSRLLYNLGCNGIGILPSIAGAKRIAHLLEGIELPPSLFDPAIQMGFGD